MFAISKVWGWPKVKRCLHMFTRYLVVVFVWSESSNWVTCRKAESFGIAVYVRCLAVLSYYFSAWWQNMLFSPALNALHSDFDLLFTSNLPCLCFAWLLLAAQYSVYFTAWFIAVVEMNYVRCLKMLNSSLSVEKGMRESQWVKTSNSCSIGFDDALGSGARLSMARSNCCLNWGGDAVLSTLRENQLPEVGVTFKWCYSEPASGHCMLRFHDLLVSVRWW